MSALRARGGGFGMLQTLITQSAVMAVNVATGVITARLLGPTGRGELGAIMIWFMLPALVATSGLQSALVYQARRDPSKAASIGSASLILGTLSYLASLAICLAALPSLMHAYEPEIVNLARIGAVAAFMNVCMTLARQYLLGTSQMHLFNVSGFLSPIAYLLLLSILVSAHALTPGSALYAQIAGTALVLVPTAWWATRGCWLKRMQPLLMLRPLARYSLHAAWIDLATVFYWHIDRLILIGLLAPADFGLYAVAVSFARLIGVLQTAVSSVTLADMTGQPPAVIESYVHRTIRLLFWLLIAGCVAGCIGGGLLLRLVYGNSFVEAVPIFRIMLFESSGSCLAQLLIEAFLASGRPKYPAAVQIGYCALLAAAMMLLAPPFGGLGAAVAMLIAMAAKIASLAFGLGRIGLGWPRLAPCRSDMQLVLGAIRGSVVRSSS
jgi:O-antigen/teichoic acid export membrane protein